MLDKNETRIDKWLWAVRIYKTRSQATEACSGGKVKINNIKVKASRKIKIGETIYIRKGIINYIYTVLKIAEKRMSAKFIDSYLQNITPENEISKLAFSNKQPVLKRDKGQGRPTKKDRRLLDKYRKEIDD
tara:strand:+ start:1169 stop:1561 length:393 start_codon:yes stop_codon:yes gene_type:complete